MSFADNVKRLREEKEYSQADLARLIDVSQQTIANYEKGKIVPSIITAVELAKKLNTTVEKLVEG